MPARRKPVEDLVCRRASRDRSLSVVVSAVAPPIPDPPLGLMPSTEHEWRSFWTSEVAHAVDRNADMGALERWIYAVDEWRRALGALRKVRIVRGSMGQPVLSPLAAYVQQREAVIAQLEDAFGMKPRARANLRLVYRQEQLTAAHVNEIAKRSAELRDSDADLLELESEYQPA